MDVRRILLRLDVEDAMEADTTSASTGLRRPPAQVFVQAHAAW